jgi:hypothetical protein
MRALRRGAASLEPGDLLAALSATALLVLLFAFAWYGVDQPPGRADGAQRATAENGWHGLTDVRWLVLLSALGAIGAALLHLNQRGHGQRTNTGGVIALLGALTAALLTVRVLIDLPDPASVVDQKLGAYLGVLSAYGMALGGYAGLRASRLRAAAQRRMAARERRAVAPPPAGR